MNNELVKLISERLALLNRLKEVPADSEDADGVGHVTTAPEQEDLGERDSERLVELVPVDFDFDFENQKDFGMNIALRFFLNGRKARYFEIF